MAQHRFTPTLDDPPLQARLWKQAGDPWRVLVACQLLNVTTRRQVDKVIDDVFDRWPAAYWMSRAVPGFLAAVVEPLGLAEQRAQRLIDFSIAWSLLTHSMPLYVLAYPGIGRYGQASYDLFIRGDRQAGLRANDRVVRAWAQLALDADLRLCPHGREWLPAPARTDIGLRRVP